MDVTYLADISKREELFQNYSLIRWITDYYADKVRVILPFFPVWTMEQISKKWEVATAKYLADILSTIPSWRNWKTSLHIFDIHNLSERFFFDSHNVNVELHTAMSLIKEKISPETIIVFPDEWAKKRFSTDFEDYEVLHCSKKRIWNTREITLEEADIRNKEVILIDDLIQSWGTLIETAKILRQKWVSKISSFATHWVFPNDSHKKLCEYVDELIVTNTIPENTKRAENIANMQVLSIQKLVEKIISWDE
jgi:phosphoribosylpyrophosphate synthetase